MTTVAICLKFQGTEKIEFFLQGTDECINLRYESLIIVDYKHKEIPVFLSLM